MNLMALLRLVVLTSVCTYEVDGRYIRHMQQQTAVRNTRTESREQRQQWNPSAWLQTRPYVTRQRPASGLKQDRVPFLRDLTKRPNQVPTVRTQSSRTNRRPNLSNTRRIRGFIPSQTFFRNRDTPTNRNRILRLNLNTNGLANKRHPAVPVNHRIHITTRGERRHIGISQYVGESRGLKTGLPKTSTTGRQTLPATHKTTNDIATRLKQASYDKTNSNNNQTIYRGSAESSINMDIRQAKSGQAQTDFNAAGQTSILMKSDKNHSSETLHPAGIESKLVAKTVDNETTAVFETAGKVKSHEIPDKTLDNRTMSSSNEEIITSGPINDTVSGKTTSPSDITETASKVNQSSNTTSISPFSSQGNTTIVAVPRETISASSSGEAISASSSGETISASLPGERATEEHDTPDGPDTPDSPDSDTGDDANS